MCYCIGGKMYAVLGLKDPPSLSLKTDPMMFEQLTQQHSVIPAPYLARYHWICLEHLEALPVDQIKTLLRGSYDMVFAKLPKKKRNEINALT
jgi:predicted DNA-binding protein (MmcQ/YjbR family)